jgi:FemAB-related protein (PEP-CTERM system-associated)
MAQLPEPPCSRSAAMPDYEIRYADAADQPQWDEYVRNHAHASPFHAFGWGNAIRKAYGHATYNLMLLAGGAGPDSAPPDAGLARHSAARVAGVLPVVHLKHPLFGNCLVSMPFADAGGILADCPEGEARLLAEAVRLGHETGAASIELRHERLLQSCEDASIAVLRNADSRKPLQAATRTHKVRMLLNLPASSELLMKSFKSKLRSQVNKALKEDFVSRTGGLELLEDFYDVFAVNMRDLGSPVHSAQLMRHCLIAFPEHARIIVVYKSSQPVAAALVVGSGKVLRNPWASSLRKYASLGANMLLYLRLLQHACDHDYRVFDFGRSTPGEGTYKFKEQWGAVPAPLYWHCISLDGGAPDPEVSDKVNFALATRCWQRLPVAVTKLVGPRIRRHISL